MIDRDRIGTTTAPTTVAIDAWRVKLFCRATGVARLGDIIRLEARLEGAEGNGARYALRASAVADGRELATGRAHVVAPEGRGSRPVGLDRERPA